MQCSLCKANGKSSSFIPPSSSESVDKCVTVEAIDVDLDRNKDGDEYEETEDGVDRVDGVLGDCLLYTSPSPRDYAASRMPSSA